MRLLYLVLLFIFCSTHFIMAQSADVKVVKFDAIESLLAADSDKVQVINFWATWCAPCIKELPHFAEALNQYSDKMDLHLISLDYADELGKVESFANKKELPGNILILDELDANLYIDKVDPSWSGAIPATLIMNPKTGERVFLEQELSSEELHSQLNALFN